MSNNTESHIFEDNIRERATSRDHLTARLALNSRYQTTDFHSWLHRRLNVGRGEHVLDVGCGTGAQSLRFLDAVGSRGSVCALDISASSVEELTRRANHDPRLFAVTADMADLDAIIASRFPQKEYTLAHSSYALYYSPVRMEVLARMANSIVSNGRVAVFTPATPHGLIEIASRFSTIPAAVMESLEFGREILEPRLRSLFWEVEVHYFQSEMRVTSNEDFVEFYRATTYHSKSAESDMRKYADDEIQRSGAVTYAKNGLLVIGRDRR